MRFAVAQHILRDITLYELVGGSEVWKAIIIFGVLGPIIGSFVFVGTDALQLAEFHGLSASEISGKLELGIVTSLLYGILGIPFSFLFGFMPAVVSGYVYWSVSIRPKFANPSAAKRFLVGSATSLITTTILYIVFFLYNFFYYGTDESFSYGWWFFAWPGCIAGGVCGLVVKINRYVGWVE
jgi:hypothetical protein